MTDERETIARWAEKKADTLESLGRTRVPPANYAVSVRRLRSIAAMLRGESGDALRQRCADLEAGTALASLRAELADVREQLRLATIDAANETARANDAERELVEAKADGERLDAAYRALRDMPSVEHSNHFDATGGGGSGCPACIRQWDWRAAHSAAIDAARKGE